MKMLQRLLRINPPAAKPYEIVAGIIATCFPDASTAVDLTPGRERFWAGGHVLAVTMSTHDFRRLPYKDGEFDLVVFDPPHLEDLGARSVLRDFGTYKNGSLEAVIQQGCREAFRVAKVGTIIKVCDHVHGQKLLYESGWVYEALGKPYEVVWGQHRQIEYPRWRLPALSARSNGSVYFVHRHGDQRHIRRVNAQQQKASA